MNRLQKDIYVLGIHDGHCSSAALIKNGVVVAAISEERLTNIKNLSGTPVLSIAKVLDIGGITPDQISLIAIASYIRITPDPQRVDESLIFRLHQLLAPYFHQKELISWAIRALHMLPSRSDLFGVLDSLGLKGKSLIYVEHHLSHASVAYFQKPWNKKTLVLTLDGMGDGVSSTVSIGEGSTICRIAQSSFYDSLGNNLYSEIASHMGMKRCEHEYKVMGLAPFGDPTVTEHIFKKIIRINPKSPLTFENISGKYLSQLQPLYQRQLAHKRFDHIAAGTQKVFEDLVVQWVRAAIKETKIHSIACAGGAFLNVKANKIIRELDEVNQCFFYPAADDGGLGVGAGLYGYTAYCKSRNIRPTIAPATDMYFGQEFSSDAVRQSLKDQRLLRFAVESSSYDVAKLLSEGKIIARFSGRDEWGPRALGNRSIMGDPRNADIIRKINFSIKQRDFWMPFAPAILEEDQSAYLKKSRFAPYMIEAFDTTPQAKDIIASLHPYDLTARPQTVNNWNPGWQGIIREFKRISGVGAILNTSFNLHGCPLVSTPEQAIWTYKNSSIDGILFGSLLLMRH